MTNTIFDYLEDSHKTKYTDSITEAENIEDAFDDESDIFDFELMSIDTKTPFVEKEEELTIDNLL